MSTLNSPPDSRPDTPPDAFTRFGARRSWWWNLRLRLRRWLSGVRDWKQRLRRELRLKYGPRLGLLYIGPPRPLRIPGRYAQTAVGPDAPRISLVTPSFNQGKFLERTLDSVLNQQYAALEYIVQDGGSRDDSLEILERYRSRLHHLESMRDRGQAHAINLGFAHATGEVMAYLNSDDILLPGALHYVGRFFAAHPEVDVVYGHRVLIDEEDRDVGRWVLPPHAPEALLWNDYVPQETLFWRRGIWEKAGGFIDETYQSALDWDLLLRFHQAGARFQRLPRFLGAFRVHAQQKTETLHKERGLPEQRRLRQRVHGRVISINEVRRRVSRYVKTSMLYHALYKVGILHY